MSLLTPAAPVEVESRSSRRPSPSRSNRGRARAGTDAGAEPEPEPTPEPEPEPEPAAEPVAEIAAVPEPGQKRCRTCLSTKRRSRPRSESRPTRTLCSRGGGSRGHPRADAACPPAGDGGDAVAVRVRTGRARRLLSYDRLQGMTIGTQRGGHGADCRRARDGQAEITLEPARIEDIVLELKPVPPVDLAEVRSAVLRRPVRPCPVGTRA